jgi:hypothetical protein
MTEPIEDRTREILGRYDKSIHPSEFTDELAELLREWLVNHAAYQSTVREFHPPHSGSGFVAYGSGGSAPAGGGGSGGGASYTDRIERTLGADPLIREPGPRHG